MADVLIDPGFIVSAVIAVLLLFAGATAVDRRLDRIERRLDELERRRQGPQ